MSTENIAAFLEAAKADPTLRQKVAQLAAASPDAAAQTLVQLSAETGHPFTAEEFRAFLASENAELSDEAVAGIAGGRRNSEYISKGNADSGSSFTDFFRNLF